MTPCAAEKQHLMPLHQRKTLVLLVHGTGDGALLTNDGRRWWQTRSRFVSRLKESVAQTLVELSGAVETKDKDQVRACFENCWDFHPFIWTGENQKKWRHTAADKLRRAIECIEKDSKKEEGANQSVVVAASPASRARDLAELLGAIDAGQTLKDDYDDVRIIAHSHGGNVVYQALLMRTARNKQSPHETKLKRWITVGTPFLRLRRFNFIQFFEEFLWRLVVFALFWCAVLFAFLVPILLVLLLSFGSVAETCATLIAAGKEALFHAKNILPPNLGGAAESYLPGMARGVTSAVVIIMALAAEFLGILRPLLACRERRKRIEELASERGERRIGKEVFTKNDILASLDDKNAEDFHKLFGGQWRNIYSVQDEAIAALSRFDEDKVLATKKVLEDRVYRLAQGLPALSAFFAVLLWAFLQLEKLPPPAAGMIYWPGAVLVLGVLLAWGFLRWPAPRFLSRLAVWAYDRIWYRLRKIGLGDDRTAGFITSAAASLNRFKKEAGAEPGSLGRYKDLRDASLPAAAESDLFKATFSPRYDDDWRQNEFVDSSALIKTNDSFLRFIFERVGRRPLVHTSYFRSDAVTDIIAYALVRDMDSAEDDKYERKTPLEKLREHESQGTQSYQDGGDRAHSRQLETRSRAIGLFPFLAAFRPSAEGETVPEVRIQER